MASTINASTSGAGGLITTADASGVLNLQTADVTRASVSSSGLTVSGLTINRVNSIEEGGQLDLCRSSDNTSAWGIDVYGSTSTPSLRFVDNVAGAARMQIDSNGVISTGTAYSSGTIGLTIGKSGAYPVDRGIRVSNSAGAAIPFIAYTSSTTQAGYILTSGSTIAFVQGSDYRLKENVSDMNKSETLDKVMSIRPVNFDWKDGNTLHNYGFLAHELQETFPQAVHGEKDAVNEDGTIKTQSVNLTALVPYLTAAIQELKAIVDTQAERIAVLENK